jgi:hypothetical protein
MMKRIAVGLIAMLALAGDYRIVDLKPQETDALVQFEVAVASAENVLNHAWTQLKAKRLEVCLSHGGSKELCKAITDLPVGRLSYRVYQSFVSTSVASTSAVGWSSGGTFESEACGGWSADHKHLVISK